MGTAAFYVKQANLQNYANNNVANPNGSGASSFDITTDTASKYIYGEKVDAKLTYTTATAVNWDNAGSLA